MMTDLLLASAHHLLAFLLVATLATELTLCRVGADASTLRMLGRIDLGYGLLFVLLIGVGILRVLYAPKGCAFYVENPLFWAKMGALAVAGLLSVPPTLSILRWSKALRRGEPAPDAVTIQRVRHWMHGESLVLLAVPVIAAAMARGIGL